MYLREFMEETIPKSILNFAMMSYRDTRFFYRRLLSPKYVLKRMFKKNMGYPLDLENPKTFNEKLQWLKLHDHNPLYTTMVDKYAVKKYVADKIGEQYIIPTLGV